MGPTEQSLLIACLSVSQPCLPTLPVAALVLQEPVGPESGMGGFLGTQAKVETRRGVEALPIWCDGDLVSVAGWALKLQPAADLTLKTLF